jgi:lauroyl/myristoyl acyltransferase
MMPVATHKEITVAALAEVLANADAAEQDAYSAVSMASEPVLEGLGLSLFETAFLAVYRDRVPRQAIHLRAVQAMRRWLMTGWQWRADAGRMRRAAAAGEPPRLMYRDWDRDQLERLLAPGRGLVLCSFHFGAYRHLSSDLAQLGFPITTAMDRAGAATGFASVHENDALRLVTPLDLEQPGAPRRMKAALERNEILLLFVDGALGRVDGTGRGSIDVELFGCPIRVRTGAVRLAAMCDAPLAVVIPCVPNEGDVPTGPGEGTPAPTPEVVPMTGRGEAFVAESMRVILRALEREIERYPSQWEGARQFNRLRLPMEVTAPLDATAARAWITGQLGANGALLADRRCVVQTSVASGVVWTDVRTMSTISLPTHRGRLARALMTTGVDAEWIDRQPADERAALTETLAALAARSLLTANERTEAPELVGEHACD